MSPSRRRAVRCWHRAVAVPVLGLLLFFSPGAASAQERFYLRVVDMLGAAVVDLRPGEISVREDGIERAVLDVRLANLPINLTILIDNIGTRRTTTSGVGAARLLHYRAGLTKFVEALPANQMVSILPLAGEPRWLLRPTIDRDRILEQITRLTPGRDGMHFLDALTEATREIEEADAPTRPVIVIVTAPARERSRVTQERYDVVIDRLLRHGVTLHAVMVTGRQTGSAGGPGDDFISQTCAYLTELTNGYHGRLAATTGIDERLTEIAAVIRARSRELSRQLVVRYDRPVGDPPAEQVAVEIARDDLRWDLTFDGRLR